MAAEIVSQSNIIIFASKHHMGVTHKQCGLRDSVVTMSVVIHQLIVGMIHQPADPSVYSHVLPRSESTVKRQILMLLGAQAVILPY